MTTIILQSSAAGQLHKRNHSLDPPVEEVAVPSETSTDNTNTQMVPNSISSESASLDMHISQTEELSRQEESAATVIQSAFRAFLVCYLSTPLWQTMISSFILPRRNGATTKCCLRPKI